MAAFHIELAGTGGVGLKPTNWHSRKALSGSVTVSINNSLTIWSILKDKVSAINAQFSTSITAIELSTKSLNVFGRTVPVSPNLSLMN